MSLVSKPDLILILKLVFTSLVYIIIYFCRIIKRYVALLVSYTLQYNFKLQQLIISFVFVSAHSHIIQGIRFDVVLLEGPICANTHFKLQLTRICDFFLLFLLQMKKTRVSIILLVMLFLKHYLLLFVCKDFHL